MQDPQESMTSSLYCGKTLGTYSLISVYLLTAPPTGLGRGFGSDAPLASLTLGGLLWLSGLLHRGLSSSGCSGLLGWAVWRWCLDLG